MTSLTEVPGEPTGGAVTGSAGSLSDQLDGAHVAVVGLGRTGRAVAEALATLGARLHLFDSQEASIEALDASAHGILATSVVSATVAGSEATAAALADSPARLRRPVSTPGARSSWPGDFSGTPPARTSPGSR